jgi:pimeloyl-ACP methyl ester carboxylesterase
MPGITQDGCRHSLLTSDSLLTINKMHYIDFRDGRAAPLPGACHRPSSAAKERTAAKEAAKEEAMPAVDDVTPIATADHGGSPPHASPPHPSAARRRSYVDVPWGQAHVTVAGAGPAVVLLHGTPRSGEEFRDVITHLTGRAGYAIDLPGFGGSDPLPGAQSIERWAEAAWTICDNLGLPDISLVGHHLGGVIGLEMAASRPGHVSSLVLSSTSWLGPEARDARRGQGTFYGFPPRDDLSHLMAMAERRRPYMPAGHPEFWNALVLDLLRAHDPEAPLHAVLDYPMDERVGLVQCPVLVVGRDQDPWFEHRSVFAARLAHSYTHDMSGTVLVEDTAPEFVRAVNAFLDHIQEDADV